MKYKIWNDVWEIKLVNPGDEGLIAQGVTNVGTCNSEKKLICVEENNYTEQSTLEIITHELTHAYIYETMHDDDYGKKKFDEEFVCGFVERYGKYIVKDAKNIFDELKIEKKGE